MGHTNFYSQWKAEWRQLTWSGIFKVVVAEITIQAGYCSLPALYATGLSLFGYEHLVLILTLSLVGAVFTHRRQMSDEKTGVFSPLALIRYITFLLITVKSSYLMSYVDYPRLAAIPRLQHHFDELIWLFIGCYGKVMANMALYRFYIAVGEGLLEAVGVKFQKDPVVNASPQSPAPKQVPLEEEAEEDERKVLA